MPRDALARTHSDLMACHDAIRESFGDLDDATLAIFLGGHDSPELRRQVKAHGDGHSLFSVPETVQQAKAVDAVVLLAVTSPKLSQGSVFDRSTPLHTVPYWHDGKRLTPSLSTSTKEYRLHFMSWQQNFSIHGIDDSHARRNRDLLLAGRPSLARLFKREKEVAIEFVDRYRDWLERHESAMVVITQTGRIRFSEPISSLIADPSVVHIEAQLRGSNHRIMEQLRKNLP